MSNKRAIALEFLKISSGKMTEYQSARSFLRQAELRLRYIKRAVELGCDLDDMAICCGVTRELMRELILIAEEKVS
jgi:hypothetical protein